MSNGTYDLKWAQDLATRTTTQIKPEVDQIRKARPLLPIVPGSGSYEETIPSFKVSPGPPPSIPVVPPLLPIKISNQFVFVQELFSNEAVMAKTALEVAMDFAFAEDIIILHGGNAAAVLKAKNIPLNDDRKTLQLQEGLFLTPPTPLKPGKNIVDSILEGIQRLQDQRQYGPYCAIVSPDLHREGMTPNQSGDAQITPILKRLKADGFQFSTAAAPRTGVVFSLGASAIELVIPWDTHIECRKVEGDATFVVVQQFRLRINDQRAVTTLS